MPEEKLTTQWILNRNLRNLNTANSGIFEDLLKYDLVMVQKSADDMRIKNKPGGPKDQFGMKASDCPSILKSTSPFHRNIQVETLTKNAQNLKDRLHADLAQARSDFGSDIGGHYVSTAVLEDQDDTIEVAARNLVDNINDENFQGSGSIYRLASLELDKQSKLTEKLAENKEFKKAAVKPVFMYTEPTTCTVLPYDVVTRLEHNADKRTYTALLQGEMIWITWPPTSGNLEVLREFYESNTNGQDDSSTGVVGRLKVFTRRLQYGIICGQKVGECLQTPPFCITLGIVTKTAVLASCSVMCDDDFFTSLSRPDVHFHKQWPRTNATYESMRRSYSTGLLQVIRVILEGRQLDKHGPGAFYQNKVVAPGVMRKLVSTWDAIKGNVADLLFNEEDIERIKEIWVDFLDEVKGQSGNTCAICAYHFPNTYEVPSHFSAAHWQQNSSSRDPSAKEKTRDIVSAGAGAGAGAAADVPVAAKDDTSHLIDPNLQRLTLYPQKDTIDEGRMDWS